MCAHRASTHPRLQLTEGLLQRMNIRSQSRFISVASSLQATPPIPGCVLFQTRPEPSQKDWANLGWNKQEEKRRDEPFRDYMTHQANEGKALGVCSQNQDPERLECSLSHEAGFTNNISSKWCHLHRNLHSTNMRSPCLR